MQLRFYDDIYEELVANYCLSARKLRYVREPKIVVALAKKDPNRHAILVVENEQLVAFFTLYQANGGSSYSNNKNNLLLQDFSTDYRHLRNGYAKQAVHLLPSFIRKHFSTVDQLTIIVNEDKLYTDSLRRQAGFKTVENSLPTIYGSQVFIQVPI